MLARIVTVTFATWVLAAVLMVMTHDARAASNVVPTSKISDTTSPP